MNGLSGRGKSEEKERAKKTKGENERRDVEGVGKERGERPLRRPVLFPAAVLRSARFAR